MYELIPAALKQLDQWVCWKSIPDESRPGKIKKIPINAKTGGQAQSNNPDTWADFTTAQSASIQFSGIGFMFANGLFGVDIDDVEAEIAEYREDDEKNQDNIISEFIHTLQSYSEYSQSGHGLHIICRGVLPSTGRRKKNVEMYSEGRFFIMTGSIAAEYAEITDCTQKIKLLHEKYIGSGSEPTTGMISVLPLNLSESEILKLAENSKQGTMFADLYAGNWDKYFTSQSEADMSFCNMLAFWCRCDEQMMDKMFQSSGLMRDKWNRKQSGSTYGKITIDKAAKQCSNVYEPKPVYRISIGKNSPKKSAKVYSMDDTGNAEHFKDLFGDKIRFSYINKNWMYYDGRKWTVDDTGAVQRMIDKTVEVMMHEVELYSDNDDIQKAYLKHIKLTRSNRAKVSMLKETEHNVPVLPNEVDTYTSLLNTPNGLINLRTGELKQHDPLKYITKIAYTEYTDKIDCPMWDNFLNDIFAGDQELIRYIQKAVGYSLTGSTQEQCAFFCYGSGRNGKSTFLDVISDMMGDYAMNIQPETIMIKKQSGGANSDIARLKGARFVTSVEPNDGMRLDEGLVKQLTGGDKVTARQLYGKEFEFSPEFKLWMGTNHKPIIRGTDVGIWRRIRLIPFTVKIPDSKDDKHLKYKLKQELPAILKWAVDGCLLWQREGLKQPLAVQQATKKYKSEMDVVSSFLDACSEMCIGEVQASELYKAYKSWAHENGEYDGMSNTKFGTEIQKRFERVKRNDGKYYTGLKLTNEYKPYKISVLK